MIPHLTLDGRDYATFPRSKASLWSVFSRTIRDCYPGKSRLIEVLPRWVQPNNATIL